ncbi:hypothetical protein [Mameliella sp.]|uniref:hypothetical protein n=1 Tax=Mameliella sp. TaxID=1924940 RepID=UPI003B50F66E
MEDQAGQGNCSRLSWGLAAVAAFLVFVLLLTLGDWMGIQAAIAAGVTLVVLGLLFSRLFCASAAKAPTPTTRPAPQPKAPPAPQPERIPEAEPAPAAHESADNGPLVKPSGALPGEEDLASRKGNWTYGGDSVAEADPAPTKEAAEPSPQPAPAAARSDATEAPLVKTGTVLAGEAELASRRGSWTYTPSG